MNALFEDGGKFHVGRVMSETDASLQIELASGKRSKVKAANVLLRFAQPEPETLLGSAEAIARDIDLDLAWEFAPEGEFAFAELARDYFGAGAGVVQEAAALLCLFSAPHYFRRLGKGRFRKAPEEIVKAALLGIERKKQFAAQVDAWADEILAGGCPAAVREQLYRILFRPDKNGAEYKAVVEAARRSGRAPLDLLQAAGAIDSPYEFHWRRFLFEEFPKGTGFADVAVPQVREDLPLASVQAFSIDDSSTTEIDDALSVQGLGSGKVVLGIHIAAPALAFAPDAPVAQIARDRLSTVYIPGHKLTMLPDAVVDAFTLAEKRDAAVVSLYAMIDEATLATLATETRVERVHIAANLRHDLLDEAVNEETLAAGLPPSLPFAAELAFLHALARKLKAEREKVRGKPENFNRPDYSFRLEVEAGKPIAGDERVEIVPRKRGSPLDLIVAEAMILANSTWGGWLAACGVPGIYRSQASLAPGVKVRMSTQPGPHAGIGVAHYAWATSPLRRYVDLVNQWQIVACARAGRSAPLVAPFKPKDVQLLAAIADFDGSYAAYNGFQWQIERYWSLRWLQQNDVRELDATVMKDGLVRADTLPLVFRAVGAEQLGRGSGVRVRVGAIDLLTLDVAASVIARLGDDASQPGTETADAGDDETDAAGPARDRDRRPRARGRRRGRPDRRRIRVRLALPTRISTLHVALGVSIAFHGALLGVRFVDPEGFNRMFEDSPLEVILVNSRSGEAPDKAQAIAQASLAGGGDAATGRATSPLPAATLTEIGDANEEARKQIEQLQQTQQQLLTMVRRELALLPPTDPLRDQGTPDERAQEDRRRQLIEMLAEIEKRINEENARPKKRYISPATREAVYALYYDHLRRKIEDRGTRNFPENQGRKLYGELTMIITVDAEGRVLDTEVVRGSGNKVLDRRAVAIVHAAGPYGRFTTAMKRQADQLAIPSRFRFTREEGLETTLSSGR